MTEKRWLNGNPQTMAEHLRSTATDRKVRLFFCARARRYWATMPGIARRAVEAAERCADDPTTYVSMQAVARALDVALSSNDEDEEPGYREDVTPGEWAAVDCVRNDPHAAVPDALDKADVDHVREIFDNPFRLPTIEPAWLQANDHAVLRLARMVYQEQAWQRLPLLADALEDAGCTDEAMLEHLRTLGQPHVRGCWVIDRLTGDRPFATDDPAAPPPELPVVRFPRRAWLVTFSDRWTPETDPLGDDDRRHVLPLLGPNGKTIILSAEWKPEGLKRSRLVKTVAEVWFFTQTGEVEWPKRMTGRREEGPAGVTYFWDDQEATLGDLAKVCEVVKVVMGLRRSGPMPGRALAEQILAGDVAQLPLLASVLEQSGSPRAEAVCALLKRDAKIAKRDRATGIVVGKGDEELTQARARIEGRACPGCERPASERVLRVSKAGPNCGRLFASCSFCNHFEWLSDPDPANAAAAAVKQPPANSAPADEALETLRAKAGTCPTCGKPRSGNRVKKEGPNKGRLFYSCSDRGCNHFEWASAATKEAGPPEAGSDAELAQMRQEYGTCDCGQSRAVNRVRKEGENKGRLFAKCDACGVFEWL